MKGELRIHVRHLRAANMCNREPRLWFKAHKLSWADFVADGIPVSVIEATGDSLAMIVVAAARKEVADAER